MESLEQRDWVVFENKGQKIFGVLHRPVNQSKVPAVLICHGFAGNKVGKYRIYVQIAQQLAKAGIASLRFDFRGSGDSEGDFSEMTIEGEVSDALQGLNYLRNYPSIDATRIGILGNSFGAAIAVLTAHADKKVKSMALLAPLFNSQPWKKRWELMLSNSGDESSKKELLRILEGYIPGPAFFPSFFKLNLEQILPDLQHLPLLHIHSEKDERVSLDQAECYSRCRQHAKEESRWIRLKQCDHDFCHPEERQMIIQEISQWYSKTL